MHIELTRESIIIKCNLEASIMTGNYEFYYTGGILCQLMGKQVEPDIKPEELRAKVMEWLPDFEPKNGQEKHMAHMLKYYHPDERYDDQMAELLQMGQKEENLWTKKSSF
jgi:hypothetical protein